MKIYSNNANRTKNSMRNIVFGLGNQVVLSVAALVCRMVFTRVLSAEYLGINGLFTNILSVLCLAELGIGSSIIYELYGALAKEDHEAVKSLMKFYRNIYNAVGVFVLAMGTLILPVVPKIVGESPITGNIYAIYYIFLMTTACSYFFSYRSALITADQRNYICVTLNTLTIVVQDVVQIIILLTTRNFILYIICQLIFTIAYNVVIYFVSGRLYPYLREKNVKAITGERKTRMLINAKALVISKISFTLVNSTDNIIISAICGLIDTGLISNYLLLTQTMKSFVKKIFDALTASVGNLNATVETKYQESVFREINFLSFWLYSWSAVAFFIAGNDMVELLFGKEYRMGFAVISIVALNYYTEGMHDVVNIYRNTLGIFKQGQYMNLITGVLNIVFSIALGKVFGVFGILLATLISRAVSVLWYYPYTVFHYGFRISSKGYFKRYIVYLLAAGCASLLSKSVIVAINLGLFANIVIDIIVAIIVPNAFYLLVFCKTTEFKSLHRRFKRRPR
ncbi:lipopolysaccharide biosynthesis protein [Clostridium transplantifaecale]|uniref:lipopolysaccharide biosynthesis protein n=1 Tax=Clostridium transplantifaecale TaxID=2479838 RepID=UPI000F62F24A|nr:hypothetical protein [Clostridium transplantifaecale]